MDQQAPSSQPLKASGEGLATASLATGIVGIVGVFVPLGLIVSAIAGLLAVGFGIAALVQPERPRNQGHAYTGIALGSVATLIAAGTIFVFRHVLWGVITRLA